MRYISDNGKVFNTEQECYEYEQQLERFKTEKRINAEKLEIERKNMMEEICKKRKELKNLTEIYQDKFGVIIGEYLPFSEFLKILYGC